MSCEAGARMHSPDAQPCEALVAAWQTLEQFWYDELGEDSAEVARWATCARIWGAAPALQDFLNPTCTGSMYCRPQGNRKVPRVEVRAALRSLGAAAESPPRSAGWDTPQRVPSDRQLQRPPHLQRQEWAHLVPQLAATGKQLLPDSDGGVQHSSAAQRSQRGPGLSSHRGAGGLSVSGCRVRQQAASASEADEVVCAEGSPEEVFAVQRDTQEAPLVSWAAPRPRHARAPCAHSGAEAGTSEQAQARGVATEQGCKAGWEWLLTHQDTHDRAALEQGLPPVRPHLSACEQLVTLVSNRRCVYNNARGPVRAKRVYTLHAEGRANSARTPFDCACVCLLVSATHRRPWTGGGMRVLSPSPPLSMCGSGAEPRPGKQP